MIAVSGAFCSLSERNTPETAILGIRTDGLAGLR
jgi:hypothetical protein